MSRIFYKLGFYTLLFAIGFTTCCWLHRGDEPQAPLTSHEDKQALKDAGFVKAEPDAPPVIRDIPRAVRPVAVVRGAVDYGPRPVDNPPGRSRARPGETATASPPTVSPNFSVSACAITEVDLAGDCRAEIVDTTPPMARLYWTGLVRLPDGGEVRRGPVLVDNVEFNWQAPVPPQPTRKRWLVAVGAGPVGRGDTVVDSYRFARPGHDQETGVSVRQQTEWGLGYGLLVCPGPASWGQRVTARVCGSYEQARIAGRVDRDVKLWFGVEF